ncbi:3-ketosteroid-9-alpha-monooxygenase, oxygenase component [BD1-7 clade bacterium]|uniref:3-ketosteroid-9-alpha-monooxygenase, oxygenase component n=1 Tax=BD1-7 clade bacterium TaxID=2029982 RepID=A0A5S9PP63_9GAMM|nr:3-ketosteroid-9-alpha-monooxygenase, oxygenase component [BD1-7 clade bacterium]
MSEIIATSVQDVRFPRGWIPIGYTIPWITPPPAADTAEAQAAQRKIQNAYGAAVENVFAVLQAGGEGLAEAIEGANEKQDNILAAMHFEPEQKNPTFPADEKGPWEVNVAGKSLVLWRDSDDNLQCIDNYCRHMGAKLSIGEIKGDSIQCPFHHWSWNGEGDCTDIAYCDKIPPRAKTDKFPIVERNGMVFLWHCPEGSEPAWEIPVMEEFENSEWTNWTVTTEIIDTHWKELIDNISDRAHFGPVHDAPCSHFENVFEDHTALQINHCNSTTLGMLYSNATYYGPCYQITEWKGELPDNLAYEDGELILSRIQQPVKVAEGTIQDGYNFPVLDTDFNAFAGITEEDGKLITPMGDELTHKGKKVVKVPGPVHNVRMLNAHMPIDLKQLGADNDSFRLFTGVMIKKLDGIPDEDSEAISAAYAHASMNAFFQDVWIWKNKRFEPNPVLCAGDGPINKLRKNWYTQFYTEAEKNSADVA